MRDKWTTMPMPDSMIKYLDTLGRSKKLLRPDPTFRLTSARGEVIQDDGEAHAETSEELVNEERGNADYFEEYLDDPELGTTDDVAIQREELVSPVQDLASIAHRGLDPGRDEGVLPADLAHGWADEEAYEGYQEPVTDYSHSEGVPDDEYSSGVDQPDDAHKAIADSRQQIEEQVDTQEPPIGQIIPPFRGKRPPPRSYTMELRPRGARTWDIRDVKMAQEIVASSQGIMRCKYQSVKP
jgi:hypothetical protein